MQTRSKSGVSKPCVILSLHESASSDFEPTSYSQASKYSEWNDAMADEFNAFV